MCIDLMKIILLSTIHTFDGVHIKLWFDALRSRNDVDLLCE